MFKKLGDIILNFFSFIGTVIISIPQIPQMIRNMNIGSIKERIDDKNLKENISKSRVAKELETSRPALDRILDPSNTSITLSTIEKVAKYVNKHFTLSFA